MATSTPSPEANQNHDSLIEIDTASTDNLPPWSKADWKDKLRMTYYISIIYLPVCILVSLIVSVYPIYIAFYLWPKVVGGDDRPELYYWHSDSEHRLSRIVGSCCFALMTVFIGLFLCSFYQALSTSPGSVPETEEWRVLEVAEQRRARHFQERKHTNGTIRWCRRCSLVKPDRSHHCRLCDQCVLKMDHHCPWIANCVGYFNYKYFFLMLTYGMLSLWLFEGSFWETALITWRDDERGAGFSFFVTLVYSLMGILLTAVTLFWSFHVYLMVSAMTTIEYCEKHKKDANGKKLSPYFHTAYESIQDALGTDPTYWFLPYRYRTEIEDGLSFAKSESMPSLSSEAEP